MCCGLNEQKIETCERHKWTYKVPQGECIYCKEEREDKENDRRARIFEANMIDFIK